ncbi:hypothetical protein N7462_009714 [Penicillium macrosclerotiorum]|uniref:uncharacterized protein n=1 Tax=Penicillium macrosclerotiorum TaxID=303699 RepID=UPI002548AFB5|nr:uncharacterized protein N7462_009714 [Penicillium macrosclerotiorum]KAJ5674275.1 hypothetical protein N7462_009714 [Penicillium macrosclerotiorum]
MALPPEQINIKRRREEEPVETLYIQSSLHQTKRRFTDFVFQRVTISSKDAVQESESDSPAPVHPATQRLLRSPRSVSSLHVPHRRTAPVTSSSGVPLVRATSPGAEIREAQRMAAAKKEAEEKRRRALQPPQAGPETATHANISSVVDLAEQDVASRTSSPSRTSSLRRFQISRSSSTSLGSLRGFNGGIQKRRADGATPGVAVLVEQLRRQPHSRQASMVADLVEQTRTEGQDITIKSVERPASPVKPRKRPVVNQAEKRWREERKSVITAAKHHLSQTLEKSANAHQSTWDEESERLAKEFEQVALEIEQDMEIDAHETEVTSAPPNFQRKPVSPPKPMKYQPRPPRQPYVAAQQSSRDRVEVQMGDVGPGADPAVADDSEDDYVYDVYIRRPLAESDMLTNPLAEFESEQQMKQFEASNRGIGVIVITAEDEEYWEHFVEDDEEEWDSEDADSNAENNPANDYPDEELSSSDEDDDPSAIYAKYRRHGASDDEEFDFDDSDSEGARYGSGFGYGQRYGRDVDSDGDSV